MNDPFGILKKSPHLAPGWKPPEVKLPPGHVCDFSISPELTAKPAKFPRFHKDLVFDPSLSPELENTPERILEGQMEQNLAAQGGRIAGVSPQEQPRGAAALAAAEGTTVAAEVADMEDVPLEGENK